MPAAESVFLKKTGVCVLTSEHHFITFSASSNDALPYTVCYFTSLTMNNSVVSCF